MTTNFDMIGREEVDDLEAILSITNSDVDEVVHTVRAEADALFTWDYERSRPALGKLSLPRQHQAHVVQRVHLGLPVAEPARQLDRLPAPVQRLGVVVGQHA